jgi:hypothetical protein
VPSFYRNDGFVKSTLGPAVPGAQIFVCTQPANVPTGLSPVAPTPTPLALIYSDPNGLVPITQPILTDGFGHYDFYVLPGTYDISVYLNGKLQQEYPDQSIGLAGGGFTAGTGITIVNGVISSTRTTAFNFVVDGGGSAITTGAKGQWSVPVNCTITGWVLTGDQSGSCVIDVLKSTYAGFPTTSSIAGSDKPTLSSAQKNENLAVSAWTTALTAGDELQINVNSASTITRANLTILVTVP